MIDIIDALEKGGFASTGWRRLGLQLKIKNNDLRIIETNNPKDVVRCLEECLVQWLITGKATYNGLAEALKKMGEGAAADHIISECVYIFILCVTLEGCETIMTHSCLVMFRSSMGHRRKSIKSNLRVLKYHTARIFQGL